MATTVWFAGLSPDIPSTFRRFWFAVVLSALATAAALAGINEATPLAGIPWEHWFFGFATAAVCAVAGVFFDESRSGAGVAGLVLRFVVPVAVAAAFHVTDEGWMVPMLLPVVALLWLSVSPVTRIGRGEERELQQNMFWWVNHQAVATAIIAGAGLLAIWLGIAAIERSMSVLFGLETGHVFYEWVLPVVGLFFVPFYWLSTLPRMSDYAPARAEQPDFIAAAIGLLGQFVLVPLLVIYAVILLAYAVQIAVTQTLPSGMIGWMVLGFVVVGAATWLVLHPLFMRMRPLVRQFRRWWFWLTIIPLALFFVAVWVRVDAYGLTEERVLLVAGGVWAALLAMVFLAGRGDIRLIPGLAGTILLMLAVGPWNVTAMPNQDQGRRLSALLGPSDPTVSVAAPQWNEEQEREAASKVYYLFRSGHGRAVLRRVLLEHGIVYEPEGENGYALMAELGYPQIVEPRPNVVSVPRDVALAVDVSATPYYIGEVEAWRASMTTTDVSFALEDGVLQVYRDGQGALDLDLGPWVARQPADRLSEPWIDFSLDGRSYRLLVTSVSWQDDPEIADDVRAATNVTGLLFADTPEAAQPTTRP